jgi:hypothetical protein
MCCSFKKLFYLSIFVLVLSVSLSIYGDYSIKTTKDSIEKWSKSNHLKLKKNQIQLEPFRIEFNASEWCSLVNKLKGTRYFDPLNSKYVRHNEYGFDVDYARELVNYWKSNFNWKTKVDYLNRFRQFKIVINDITIHFIRIRIKNCNRNCKDKQLEPVRLLLIDGWPGSFSSFYKVIDYIAANTSTYSFEIYIPSIPGYGYSIPLDRPIDVIDTAQYFDLMMRYFHGDTVNYYVHGEDWGNHSKFLIFFILNNSFC